MTQSTKTCFIGVDIGTQGTKAALYRSDGVLLADAFEASHLISQAPDHVEQDPEEMYGSVLRTVAALMKSGKATSAEVCGIGVDAQMSGIQAIGPRWEAVTPYDSWLDCRCAPYVDRMKEREEQIIASTGGQLTVAHGAKMLWWKNEHPEIYRKAARFVLPTTYSAGRLCGLTAEQAYIDVSHLHFTGFSDALAEGWNADLMQAFDIDPQLLPPVVQSSAVIGGLTADAARACGLLQGTPVVAGCGDSAASALGAGMTIPGRIYDVAGTASIFSCTTQKFAPDTAHKTILYMHAAVKNLWSPLAYISGGGLCISWAKDLLGGSYKELDALASEVAPGSDGLLFLPHFAGRTCPNDNRLRGTWLGLSWQQDKAHLFRSVMESIAYEYKMYYDCLCQADASIGATAIYGVGGGAYSRVFGQIKADVLGIPYIPLTSGETAPFGSAMLAGYGVGYYSDLSVAVEQGIRAGEPIVPNAEAHARYAEPAAAYVRALEHAGDLFAALSSSEN